MSFAEHYTTAGEIRPTGALARFARLLEPQNAEHLEAMAAEAQRQTRRYFGRTIRLFAPLYVSNECVNICRYCGFSRDNPIHRVTLTADQAEAEARHLLEEGFRSILLVAGEHPKFVSNGYLQACIERLRPLVPSIALEVGPMEQPEYEPLVRAGAEGLVVYQETYNREAYRELHPSGPKRDFDWRLACPERAYAAGFRRIGVGALFGLAPWQEEALTLGAHIQYLLKHCWKAMITVSLPRLRPAAGEFEPTHSFTDRAMVQLICALRVCFPQIGIVLSTREPASLRDGLMPLGITHISAGSHTEPGGYTGAGADAVQLRAKNRAVETVAGEGESGASTADCAAGGCGRTSATEQFNIADERTPAEMAARLRELDLEPVWKDWDEAILGEVSHT